MSDQRKGTDQVIETEKAYSEDGAQENLRAWRLLLCLTVLSSYFYVFMEWLHFYTKPSFLSVLDLAPSLFVLIISPLPIVLIAVSAISPFLAVGTLVKSSIVSTVARLLARVFPTLVLTGLAFVTFDVFTKTLFNYGVSDTVGRQSSAYILLLIGCAIATYLYLKGLEKKNWPRQGEKALVGLAVILPLLSFLALAWSILSGQQVPRVDLELGDSGTVNVLLLSGDGLEADHMSVYGYRRDTSPFLREMVDEFLICENAFANAGPTGASIASLLSGKLPTQTRLVYPPDILRGRHAYQHLPLILRNAGYRSTHLSIRHFADAYDLNMRESFDSSNFRTLEQGLAPPILSRLVGLDSSYFLEHVRDRLEVRLMHVWGVAAMEDAFSTVQQEKTKYTRDHVLLDELQSFIDESSLPFFAHVHFLGTHGPRFRPRKQTFSKDKEQTDNWMEDFYDDSILDFDQLIEDVFKHLSNVGKLEQTLIVIHTDHAQEHRTNIRIPMMIRFPNAEHSGRIVENTQLLDISPTVLEVVGLERPAWMGGRSLLSDTLDPMEPVLSVGRITERVVTVEKHIQLDPAVIKPPFFTMRFLRATVCDTFYQMDLKLKTLTSSRVVNHTSPCPPMRQDQNGTVAKLLLDHLSSNGYDISTVSELLP